MSISVDVMLVFDRKRRGRCGVWTLWSGTWTRAALGFSEFIWKKGKDFVTCFEEKGEVTNPSSSATRKPCGFFILQD